MNDFGINEMLEMQAALQEKYKDLWKPIGPERGQDQLLWMIGEIGEVIDIVKKHGGQKACQDQELRTRLIEEMADVLMYYNDILLCYGISAEELKQAYTDKFEKNMKKGGKLTAQAAVLAANQNRTDLLPLLEEQAQKTDDPLKDTLLWAISHLKKEN